MPTVDNPIGALQELSQARGGRPTPFYVLQSVSGESHCPHFVYEAAWADLRAVGEGSSKKEAKKWAAQNLLVLVRNSEEGETNGSNKCEDETESEVAGVKEEGDTGTVKYYRGNQVGNLQELVLSRGLTAPSYEDGLITGPPHKQHFTIIASAGGIVRTGEGRTKKEAKHQAAGAVLEQLIEQSNCSNVEPSKTETSCEEEVEVV